MRINGLATVLLSVGLLLIATGPTENALAYSLEDMAGRQVDIPDNVERIVAVGAGSLRLVCYLGATELVVGVEQFEKDDQNRPYILAYPELTQLPSVGPRHGGEPELIAASRPQVVLWSYATARDADELQQKLGVPVVVLDYGTLGAGMERFFTALNLTAKVLGKSARAVALADYVQELVDDLRHRCCMAEDGPTVYVGGIGYRGAQGLCSTEPAYPPFVFLNARNVAGTLDLEHAMISSEQLLIWDPDVIFIDQAGLSLVLADLKRPEYLHLSAVRQENLYGLLPYNYYTTNLATLLANAYFIGKVLYPDRFADVDPEQKADCIYREFLGKPVYQEMAERFGGYTRLELHE